ncbi:hypothetical protein POTOM_062176 [Populus tomentosa]|uniref:EF-hand domain-containing protein n=1 Tax=Populus tomentosa TaxID=118781 RepID=A0A8X8BXZ6_POPTO|nr:hypothetical protein POTOM_062176 [Populus tomentosa]
MATTESLVAQIQGLSSNAVDLGLLSIHLKKADEVLHNESTRLLAFLEQLDPTLHSLGNSVVVSDEIRGESLGVVWKTSIMQLVLDCNVFHESTQDYNEDGKLSFSEFSDLIKAFGNQVADNNEPLINCCPVCGEILEVSDKLNTLVHLSLCFDEGTGNQVMTGGLLINSLLMGMNLLTVNFMSCLLLWWMFKLSEWAHFSSYDVGLNSGSSASHILVKETLLVAREGRVWCLEDRLVLGGFDWDPTLQEKACWSRRPFDQVCMPLDKWRGVRVLLEGDTNPYDSDSDFEVFELFDPAATGKVVGRISLSCSVEDYNEDGKLSFSEFSDLIKAFGNQVADNKF